MTEPQRQALRRLVRSMYDFQRLKNQAAGRGRKKAKAAPPVALDADDIAILTGLSGGLENLEAKAMKEVEQRVKREPMGRWLMNHRGIGPVLAGVFLTEVDIRKARTISSLWLFAGLACTNERDENNNPCGKAMKLTKGQKAPYNTFLKTKVLGVGGDSILKACVRVKKPSTGVWEEVQWELSKTGEDAAEAAEVVEETEVQERAEVAKETEVSERADTSKETTPPKLVTRYVTGEYAKLYAQRRWRRLHQVGADGKAPWGNSSAHRHRDAVRHMMKIFLANFWTAWREAEGLPTRPAYAEEKLGRKHGS